MHTLKGAVQNALRTLTKTSRLQIESSDEYAIWRHQLRNEPNPAAQNVMGEDPKGLYWKTQDFVISVKREGMDDLGRSVFYCSVEPVHGDLIITVAGSPKTQADVRRARRLGVYKIVDFDVRRDPGGRIMYCKVFCKPDRSGQWAEGR